MKRLSPYEKRLTRNALAVSDAMEFRRTSKEIRASEAEGEYERIRVANALRIAEDLRARTGIELAASGSERERTVS